MASRPIELGEAGRRAADRVAQARRRLGWEQRHLAARLAEAGRPMSPSVIGKLETGARRMDVDDLVALAAVLELSPAELLDPSEEPDEDEGPGPWVGPVETQVRLDVEDLGELLVFDGMAGTLATVAYQLAHEIDRGGGEGGRGLPALARELRSLLAELQSLKPEGPGDDDDLDDLASPD